MSGNLISVVASDLAFLKESWDQSASDDSLRRSSPVLRRLLSDGDLQRAWKAAGLAREPIIRGTSVEDVLAEVDRTRVMFAAAGGATYAGASLQGVLARNYAAPPEEIARRAKAGIPAREMGLSEFARTGSVFANGRLVSRRRVVKFVANKLGGAHFDPARGGSDEERDFATLDSLLSIRLLDKPMVYFELLAAGQMLVGSTDVMRLLSHE